MKEQINEEMENLVKSMIVLGKKHKAINYLKLNTKMDEKEINDFIEKNSKKPKNED